MLAKLTSKNRITLPKAALSSIGSVEYFDVSINQGSIVLTPIRIRETHEVRVKLEQFGITEVDLEDALAWARR